MGTTVCVVGLVARGREQRRRAQRGRQPRLPARRRRAAPLTEDHSLVETLVREGRITAEEAEVHPQRNVLTRALGVEAAGGGRRLAAAHPATATGSCCAATACSTSWARTASPRCWPRASEPDVVARRLAAEAEAAGGRDNITTVVVDVADAVGAGRRSTTGYRRITTPAVDLADLDDDGPRTDTVHGRGRPRRTGRRPIDDADDGGDEPTTPGRRPGDRRAGRRLDAARCPAAARRGRGPDGERPSRRGGRWRTAAVRTLAFAAGDAVAGRRRGGRRVHRRRAGSSVTTNGQVALYRGQEGGVLWIQPTVEERSDLACRTCRRRTGARWSEAADVPDRGRRPALHRRTSRRGPRRHDHHHDDHDDHLARRPSPPRPSRRPRRRPAAPAPRPSVAGP